MSKNKMFKITSGEMIITEIVSENDTELTIKAPMLVHFTPTPEGKLGINLFPLNPFATSTDENISLKKDHIIFFVDINKDIEAQGRIRDIAQAKHEIDLERETLGLMRKENVYGTIGTIGAIGLEGLGAWQARETEQELDLILKSWDDASEQRFISKLRVIYGKQPTYTKPISQQSVIPRLTPQFGGGK